MAFSPAIKAAATPKPIRSRARTSAKKLSATPNKAAPAAATSINTSVDLPWTIAVQPETSIGTGDMLGEIDGKSCISWRSLI